MLDSPAQEATMGPSNRTGPLGLREGACSSLKEPDFPTVGYPLERGTALSRSVFFHFTGKSALHTGF